MLIIGLLSFFEKIDYLKPEKIRSLIRVSYPDPKQPSKDSELCAILAEIKKNRQNMNFIVEKTLIILHQIFKNFL
jgi:hypothetical protein